jgi:hypothetical protein
MSLKTENSRRVAKSRPVCMGLNVQDEFACKQVKKEEFQTGPKFVRYRVNRVLEVEILQS